jgi:uncharacterized protein (DUF1778 family)
MSLSSQSKTERIDLRASLAAKELLRDAAAICHKSISEFILDASLAQANQTLANRRVFKLDDKAWEEFQKILDRPANPNQRLKKLLTGAE